MFSYNAIVKKLSKDYMVEEMNPGIIRVAGVDVTMEDFLCKPDKLKSFANTITFSLVKKESIAQASKEGSYNLSGIKKYIEEMK